MTTITLATFPLPDRTETYWQVNVSGFGPVSRETTSQDDARATFDRVCAEQSQHGRKIERRFWDGYNGQETVL